MAKQVEPRYGWTDKVYYIPRISAVIMFMVMFLSEFNPARIYTKMNKNISLFTAAVSGKRLTANVSYEMRIGAFEKGDFTRLQIAALLMVAGIIALCIGQCVSLGRIKLKRISNYISAVGTAMTLFGAYRMVGTFNFYKRLDGFNAEKYNLGYNLASEHIPGALWLTIVLAGLSFLAMVLIIVFQPKAKKSDVIEMGLQYKLFLLFIPFVILCFLFSYLPLYGWRYAFFDYNSGPNPLTMDDFVGFKWFSSLISNSETRRDIAQVMKNTLIMSGLGIATSWLAIAFAIFLTEIKTGWFRRLVQVFTTIPNFISWVLVYAIAFAIFSTDGFVNNFLNNLTGIVHTTDYLASDSMLYLKMLLWGIWKGIGWSAIIYIAGISGIDVQLYEAATVDGAGRFQKMWHVTVPGLMPTYCVLLLMSIAGILSNGMDQYLVFENANNYEHIRVLDLYVYQLGIGSGKIPLSTVVGMLKTIVSVTLLFIANGVSKLIRGDSIM